MTLSMTVDISPDLTRHDEGFSQVACSVCHAWVRPGAFCRQCGHPFRAANPGSSDADSLVAVGRGRSRSHVPSHPVISTRRSRRIPILAALGVPIVVASAWIAISVSNDPATAAGRSRAHPTSDVVQSGCSSVHSAVDYLIEGAPFTTMVGMLIDNASSLFEEAGDSGAAVYLHDWSVGVAGGARATSAPGAIWVQALDFDRDHENPGLLRLETLCGRLST
jgi:hypothetical protein